MTLRLVKREKGSMAYWRWLVETPPEVTLINGGVTPERPKLCVVRTASSTTNGDGNGKEHTE
jgi:hypothetical protein